METASTEPEPAGTPKPTIRLDHWLKRTGRARSGGEAKHRIQGGEVQVNGEPETRRSRKLVPGDRVTLDGETAVVDRTTESAGDEEASGEPVSRKT